MSVSLCDIKCRLWFNDIGICYCNKARIESFFSSVFPSCKVENVEDHRRDGN